jgi:mannose-6-phosphate isomerase-like protein (cupin superfamily)
MPCPEIAMNAFEISELIAACRASGHRYHEFVQRPTMSAGIFILPTGAVDDHQPHNRDELYCILSGRGVLQVQGADHEVAEGRVVFVPAGVEHHFHSISDELTILVFFGGETSPQSGSTTV